MNTTHTPRASRAPRPDRHPPPERLGNPRPGARPSAPDVAPARGGIDSRALFGDARTLMIRHAGASYLLRITQQNKLILTK